MTWFDFWMGLSVFLMLVSAGAMGVAIYYQTKAIRHTERAIEILKGTEDDA